MRQEKRNLYVLHRLCLSMVDCQSNDTKDVWTIWFIFLFLFSFVCKNQQFSSKGSTFLPAVVCDVIQRKMKKYHLFSHVFFSLIVFYISIKTHRKQWSRVWRRNKRRNNQKSFKKQVSRELFSPLATGNAMKIFLFLFCWYYVPLKIHLNKFHYQEKKGKYKISCFMYFILEGNSCIGLFHSK